jgi:hypothetical protein
MKYLLLAFLMIIFAPSAKAYEQDLDGLLKAYVKPVSKSGIQYNGVNYDAWSQDARHKKVRNAIQAVNPEALSSDQEKLAFWINAYNFFTVDLLIKENERDSIKDLGGALSSPWKKYKWTVNGKEYSLDNIEHDIIRKFGEARIHFAVNCAAKSCPDLRAEAYTASNLDAQLEDQTRKTLTNNSKGYSYDANSNEIKLSKVMDWYKKDFNNGDLNTWMQKYKPEVNNDTKIGFFNYDWSLNKQ